MVDQMTMVPVLKDRYVINSGVFYLLGIMVFVPFQFFINSFDFWMYKFKPPPSNGPPRPPPGPGPPRPHPGPRLPPISENFSMPGVFTNNILSEFDYNFSTEDDNGFYHNLVPYSFHNSTPPDKRTPIQANITTGFNVAFRVALLGALLICSFWSNKLPPPEQRLKWSLWAICFFFSVNVFTTHINGSHNISWFFAGMMIIATIINFCTGMATASLYELISNFPPTYYASLQSGNIICGIISSFLQIGITSTRLKPNDQGAIFFSCGTVILILTTVYFSLTIKDYKYYVYKIDQNDHQINVSRPAYLPRTSDTPLSELLLKIKWYYGTLIFVEGTTHLVYPGLAALVVPYNREEGNIWKEIYFVPVITFLGFQVCNLIGRETARIIKIPKNGLVVFIVATLRISIVPLMIFCNALPRSHLPVLFDDSAYAFILATLGFSEGILINLAIVAIPTILGKGDREAVMVLVPLISAATITLSSGLNMLITNLI